jgi:formate hydrogenlyase transcriptional activator
MHKGIEVIPADMMDGICRHWWTGNIRELEHFIERSVILSHGITLDAPMSELMCESQKMAQPVTLRDAERPHIVQTLGEVGGVIGAAAVRLGVPRSTLFYKMRRLGVEAQRATHSATRGTGASAHA